MKRAAMAPTPHYEPTADDAAYQLRYSWTGWPSRRPFRHQPTIFIDDTKPLWESDGMRVLEYRWTAKLVQVLFSCTPNVAPQFLAARAKGRLDHALRTAGTPVQFSRKTAVRALGDNTRRDVEVYIEQQVGRRDYVDDGFADKLKELTVVNDRVDLAQPTETVRGRYWCNLHLVLVVEQHASIHDLSLLRRLRDSFLRIAEKKDHAVSRLSVMPDHLHAALRTQPDETPLEIVFAYQNNLAHMAGGGSLWQPSFYVGTFGEYSMQAVRNQAGQA